MNPTQALLESSLTSLKLLARGKVRDIYEIDAEHLLIVASDRISAFDCILPDPIPGKGKVLTAVSNFWFHKLSSIIPNHLTSRPLDDILQDPSELEQLKDRAVIVKKLNALPVEAVVRGYLIGSGWKEYLALGSVCGIALPNGLAMAQKLPEAIFTPSTKAAMGTHDENITFEDTVKLVGSDIAEQLKSVSLQLYNAAAAYALQRGIIIADTKFEFGLDENGKLVLIDEILTPDSSRFWPEDQYQTGMSPPSFDKQFVRDYLECLSWNKQPPAPHLPADIIEKTSAKYREAQLQLTGHS